MLNCKVQALDRVSGGGNNRLYRAGTARGPVAVKCYFHHLSDTRNRQAVEFQALEFLGRHGVTRVPATIAQDLGTGIAIYSWIEGQPIGRPTRDDLAEMAAFAARLRALRQAEGASDLPLASEACLSGRELVDQVRRRLTSLSSVIGDEGKLLATMIGRDVPSILAEATERATAALSRQGLSMEIDLPSEARTLSPSDFGTHNALKTDHGLVYLDFEYFGWDDPVKLVVDTMLHPGMKLSEDEACHFAEQCREQMALDEAFPLRLAAFRPLYALRWAMIVLNVFIPERWARMRFARDRDLAETRRQRLALAEAFLADARRTLAHQP